jgi:hypothetical protein
MNGLLLSPFRRKGPLDELAASGLGGLGHLLQRCLQILEMEGSITREAGQDMDVALAKAKGYA